MAGRQQVNYLQQHQEANIRLVEDSVSAIDISIYNALFLIWNACGWADVLSIDRADIMQMAKVGNKNTYTDSLKRLHAKGYIDYMPSRNPLVGSQVTITTFGKSGITISGKSSGNSRGNSTGNSSGTLYKQLETLETEKTDLGKQFSSAVAEVEKLKAELAERDARITQLQTDLEEERKKSSAKKKKEDRTPHWQALVKEWYRFYAACHRDIEPSFDATQGAALRSLMQRIRRRAESNKAFDLNGWDQTTAVQCLRDFLTMCWQNSWHKAHFSLSNLNSKFDELINGNESATKNGQQPGGLNAHLKQSLVRSVEESTGTGRQRTG